MPDDIEFIGNSSNGKSDFITWVYDPNPRGRDTIPLEDLFVWVSFRALPKNRSVIESDGTYSSSFFDSEGIQFISTTKQNGKDYMTTDYTNIGGSQTGNDEAFGIQNIEISYGSELVPQAKITFVDVRGAGLFNGYEYEDEKGIKYNSSKFSSWFRLPYPLFELSVKGFYGKAVTYCLHLRNFHAKYDSSSGNFIIEADFIGYTFSFLADILLKYVLAVTSSEAAVSAIDRQNERRLSVYPNSNEIIPLNQFIQSLGKLTSVASELKDQSKEYKELKTVNSLLNLLNRLSDAIGKPVNENISSIYGQNLPINQLRVNVDQLFVRDVGLIAESSGQLHDIIVEDVTKFVNEYNEFIDGNKNEFSYLEKYKIQKFDIKTPALSYQINEESADIINQEVLKDGISQARQTVTSDILRSRLSLGETSQKEFYIINYHEFRQEINELLATAQDKQQEVQKDVNLALNNKLAEELGFDLKIESVMNIILGNVEAFLDIFYNICLEADNPNIQADRTANLASTRNDISEIDQRIYPFPAAFDSDTGEEIWIGDVVGENNPAFPEIRFIKEVINSLVANNSKEQKNRQRNKSKRNVQSKQSGWVAVAPFDFLSNELGNIDELSYAGNEVPEQLAQAIVKRAIAAYEGSLYNDSRFNNIAKVEGAYTASQVVNNTIKQVIKDYGSDDFSEDVIIKSGFPNRTNLGLFGIANEESYDFNEGVGLLVGGYGDDSSDFIDLVLSQDSVQRNPLAIEIDRTIERFKNSLDDTLINRKINDYHRSLDKNGLYIKGDASDYFWNQDVQKNINKFYKNRTSNILEKNKRLDSPLLSIINDLTIFDGQINQTIDFSKSTDRNEKFVNVARKYVGVNPIKFGDDDPCLFDTNYYNNSSELARAYYFLLTCPINNFDDFYGLLKAGGMYKIGRLQFAWICAQFYRARYIEQNGFDIFDKTIQDVGVSLQLGNDFNNFKVEFEQLRDRSKQYLPNLSDFNVEVVDSFIFYYNQWITNYYLTNEDNLKQYCNLSEDGINAESADFNQYKSVYAKVLALFIDSIDIMLANPLNILNESSDFYSSLGLKQIQEIDLSNYVKTWLESFKRVVNIENNERKSIQPPNQSISEEQEFYVNDKDIKLSTYNYFKNLYDKWLAGSKSSQIHNYCSFGGGGAPRDSQLIDRFHFIDRTWSYIGDRAVINPKSFLHSSSVAQMNLYQAIGSLLRDSKFDFHVLPSWVNYKNLDDIRDMWTPQTDVENISAGASYICMYMGGKSKVLDIGKKVGYVNDGFDLRNFDTEIPKGFKDRVTPEYVNNLEDQEKFKYNMVAFRVAHADQNQSIFIDIDVNQQENRETAESIQALSDAFDSRGGTKRLYKGVNLYNVFAIRNYKCKVKSMGNMMIHPLTYFQLDNVPFFHGAYLITKVSHTVTPHFVETNFEGTRISKYIVPIVESPTTYVNIPLNDTLFTDEELSESVIRPLQPEDPNSFASNGENSQNNIVGQGVPTSQEILEAQNNDNQLLQVQFTNTNQNFNFNIQPNLTQDQVLQDIQRVYNPNNPITFKGVGLGNCYGWVKRSLYEIGVIQDPYFGIDAWTFYSGLDDNGMIHVSDEQFSLNLANGWSNNSMQAAGIPDGSFIFSYYPATEYTYRSIDRMVQTGISGSKVNNLKRLKSLDTKVNNRLSNYFNFSDTVPISEQKFSLKGYKSRWKDSQITDYARSLDGNLLPFSPVTHVCVFINGQCFHQGQRVFTNPTPSMRIVAYYPFKDKFLNKI